MDQSSSIQANNRNAGANIAPKPIRSLSKSERMEQDAQIREYFNMKCEICSDVQFETLIEANRHYHKVHKTHGYLTCCGKKFYKRFKIINHIRYHINPNAYRCDQCNKCFMCEIALKLHIDNHAPLDARAFKCSYIKCPSSFTTATSLRIHVKNSHSPKNDEQHPCDKCSKR